jgi:hypothetical protein
LLEAVGQLTTLAIFYVSLLISKPFRSLVKRQLQQFAKGNRVGTTG